MTRSIHVRIARRTKWGALEHRACLVSALTSRSGISHWHDECEQIDMTIVLIVEVNYTPGRIQKSAVSVLISLLPAFWPGLTCTYDSYPMGHPHTSRCVVCYLWTQKSGANKQFWRLVMILFSQWRNDETGRYVQKSDQFRCRKWNSIELQMSTYTFLSFGYNWATHLPGEGIRGCLIFTQ